MTTLLGAAIALAAVLAVFGALAMLAQALRTRRIGSFLRSPGRLPSTKRIGVEEVCAIDPKRRLLLIRYDDQRILLLTGGPADVILSPLTPAATA